MHSIHVTHLHLNAASLDTIVACHAKNDFYRKWHIREARKRLVMALAGEDAGAGTERCRAVLLDVIAMAILDSNDIDATPESQAEAVLDAILDNCLPLASVEADQALAAE